MQADGQPLSSKGNEGSVLTYYAGFSCVNLVKSIFVSGKKSLSLTFPELDSEICHN